MALWMEDPRLTLCDFFSPCLYLLHVEPHVQYLKMEFCSFGSRYAAVTLSEVCCAGPYCISIIKSALCVRAAGKMITFVVPAKLFAVNGGASVSQRLLIMKTHANGRGLLTLLVQSLTIQMTLADPENKALCAVLFAPVLHCNLFIQ
ncbi:unnamed protein product [Pleuronectes platessa]|uniref:Uncharacterized protein n=1 Tax=Pleuronectes platessa TaxID=8262 RepID=A0A9N7Z493_PLEPL|nr:unnamed protein product [Pleuronectes platessa]